MVTAKRTAGEAFWKADIRKTMIFPLSFLLHRLA